MGVHCFESPRQPKCAPSISYPQTCTNVASGHRLLLESALPSIFPFRKTKPPKKLPRQRAGSTISTPKPKKRVHAQADGQPPIDVECRELFSTPDENQLPLHEVVVEDENLFQPHTSDSHCECRKIIAALEAQLATTRGRESKLRAEVAGTEQALAAQAILLSRARAELTSAQTELAVVRDTLKAKNLELNMLQDELVTAQQRLRKVKDEYEPFGIEKSRHSDEDVQFYTGLPDYESFLDLV